MKNHGKPHVMLVGVNGDGPTTGFATRVILIAQSLVQRNFAVTLLRFYPALVAQGSWRDVLRDTGVDLIEIPVLPMSRSPFLRKLSHALANPLIHAIAKLRGVDLIQAEAHNSGLATLATRWCSLPVVVDFHGAAPEEAVNQKAGHGRSMPWLDAAEALCLQRADALLVVSPKMVEHLQAKHRVDAIKNVHQVPVNVESGFFLPQDRAAARQRLGFDDRHRVFVYSGGAQEYQCIEEMAALFAQLRTRNPDSRLLVLSAQKQDFIRIFQQRCPEHLEAISYHSTQKHLVPEFLAAADMAFLLRRDDTLNIVSCPTKFGEYLACGLPVITTDWAGHAPAIVREHGVGIVVDFDYAQAAARIESFVGGLSADLAARCIDIARRTMAWEFSERSLLRCYEQLIPLHGSAQQTD